MSRLLVPLGTRPEIIKMTPVVRALRSAGHAVSVLATGQHFDRELTDAFFEELGLRPDQTWTLPSEAGPRLAAMVAGAEEELLARHPDLVLLLGDTHTVAVFAPAARRHGVPVAHLEAGLRSRNETSVEEMNRKVAAACATLHLAPTELAARFLAEEGVASERIHVVGNPVLDVLRSMGAVARPPERRAGVLFTAHRATNVDDGERLRRIVAIVRSLAERLGPVYFPVHPRTRSRLAAAGLDAALDSDGVHAGPPLPYGEMVERLGRVRVVVTDSGGLQEEAAWMKVPTVVLRRSTPRWEGVAAGVAKLVDLDVDLALRAAVEMAAPEHLQAVADRPCPYGDGRTAERVVELLADPAVWASLALRSPDFVGQPVPA